jgi:hypothetical protein
LKDPFSKSKETFESTDACVEIDIFAAISVIGVSSQITFIKIVENMVI